SLFHPLTIAPIDLDCTPIYIKCSFSPDEVGTKLSADKDENQGIIKGVTSVSDVDNVRDQGAVMI
ncbi:hypothetical protein NAI36_10725, partial [Francisella tularensis subsp. holarctica]